jgi:hypothetical protein
MSSAPTLNESRYPMENKHLLKYTVPIPLGHDLYASLSAVTENSPGCYLAIESEEKIIGILVGIEEFDLLMSAFALIKNPAALSELLKEDDDEGSTYEEAFAGRG